MGHFETFLETFWSQKMLVCGLEVCVLQLVGQGPVAQKYMREAGPRGRGAALEGLEGKTLA